VRVLYSLQRGERATDIVVRVGGWMEGHAVQKCIGHTTPRSPLNTNSINFLEQDVFQKKYSIVFLRKRTGRTDSVRFPTKLDRAQLESDSGSPLLRQRIDGSQPSIQRSLLAPSLQAAVKHWHHNLLLVSPFMRGFDEMTPTDRT